MVRQFTRHSKINCTITCYILESGLDSIKMFIGEKRKPTKTKKTQTSIKCLIDINMEKNIKQKFMETVAVNVRLDYK